MLLICKVRLSLSISVMYLSVAVWLTELQGLPLLASTGLYWPPDFPPTTSHAESLQSRDQRGEVVITLYLSPAASAILHI